MKRIIAAALALVLGCCGWTTTRQAIPVSREMREEAAPCVALTFDDGPSCHTARLLDGLRERGVQATFFLLGCQLEGNEELVRRMRTEGHQIGSHTHDHALLTELTTEAALADLARCDLALCTLLGEGDYWVRPPYGAVSDEVRAQLDVPVLGWSVDPRDWECQNAAQVLAQIAREARDGDIILLHDCYASTVDAALQAVDLLHSRGFEVVTAAELLRRKEIAPKAGRIYYQGR